MILVLGHCFSYHESYPDNSEQGEIPGWNLIHQEMSRRLEKYPELELLLYGTEGNSFCLTIKKYSKHRNENQLIIPLEKMARDQHSYNLTKYYDFLQVCGLKNFRDYKPRFMVLN